MIRIVLPSLLASLVGVAFCDTRAAAENAKPEDLSHRSEISDDKSAATWPLAMRDRPLTLAQGMFSAGASIDMASRFDEIRLGLGGLSGLSYGITDALTIGVSYDLGLSPSEGKGPLALHAGYSFYSEGNLILTATGSFTRDLLLSSNAASMGLMYWYNLGERLSIFGGGDQISAAIEPSVVTMSLPVALGYQLNAHSFFSIGTQLADFVLADETEMLPTSLFGRDALPLGLTATHSPANSLDLFVSLSTDLVDAPSDALSVGVGAIYYGGAR